MTSTTSTSASDTAAPAAAQGSHMWVLTLDLPGRTMATRCGTSTPAVGATRYDVFLAIRSLLVADNPEMASANTVFFSLEPNRL
ncbi:MULTISPECIES: hypothetical protein [Streptomyces]|uniref:hypothetical protein n=1 Tax=Streptomyces TaxID=1883 RepID=UPI00225636D6|nr:hypothetical protein [Streptomyces sp. NBC_00160]MCX5304695.1 hypothetical protein [Streptomyces sp. NBC_00160]